MKRHLFLTGDKQVGKSTLIRKALQESPLRLGGFLTVRTEGAFREGASVHLLLIGEEVPGEENFLFFCREPWGSEVADRFNRLGCAALENICDKDLIIMDELGPKESQAERFQTVVLKTLDGEIPVLGVLQKADGEFIGRIAAHSQVEVLEVTKQNRDDFEELLQQWLSMCAEKNLD